MTHTKDQKKEIISFLQQLKTILKEHNMRLDVPVKISNINYGDLGSLEHNYQDLYIIEEQTFLELYSSLDEENND